MEKPKIKKPETLEDLEGDVVVLERRRFFGLIKRKTPTRYTGTHEGKAMFLARYHPNLMDRIFGTRSTRTFTIARYEIQESKLKVVDGVVRGRFKASYFHPEFFSGSYAMRDEELREVGL